MTYKCPCDGQKNALTNRSFGIAGLAKAGLTIRLNRSKIGGFFPRQRSLVVEQPIRNRQVMGSNPIVGSKMYQPCNQSLI